ncbi:MAG: DUF2911 domain-containing protein [Flavobacteriales bacterium]|nr:DUF2911 domain-containing protein [Flavobacteriales bacterium]
MKFLKWLIIILLLLLGLSFVGFKIAFNQTKKHSPETTVSYKQNGLDVAIIYSRPFKKEREIFGGLVPYGKVWRTGANEATIFRTKTDLMVDGNFLPAGEYTLWTLPNESSWEVIFNRGEYFWGVNSKSEASREADLDVLNIKAKVQKTFKIVEQFTIEIERTPPVLSFKWDDIVVEIPLNAKSE